MLSQQCLSPIFKKINTVPIKKHSYTINIIFNLQVMFMVFCLFNPALIKINRIIVFSLLYCSFNVFAYVPCKKNSDDYFDSGQCLKNDACQRQMQRAAKRGLDSTVYCKDYDYGNIKFRVLCTITVFNGKTTCYNGKCVKIESTDLCG